MVEASEDATKHLHQAIEARVCGLGISSEGGNLAFKTL